METRPQEAARLRAKGYDIAAIAEYMRIYEQTVRLYLRQMSGAERKPRPMKVYKNGLTARATNILAYLLDIREFPEHYPDEAAFTPEAVAGLTEMQLLKTCNCAKVTVREIKAWLAGHGLHLREELPQRMRKVQVCPHCGGRI